MVPLKEARVKMWDEVTGRPRKDFSTQSTLERSQAASNELQHKLNQFSAAAEGQGTLAISAKYLKDCSGNQVAKT